MDTRMDEREVVSIRVSIRHYLLFQIRMDDSIFIMWYHSFLDVPGI